MKSTIAVLISAVCWSARLASAATGHVYTYDAQHEPRQHHIEPRRLSPQTARLVLAQRQGVEDLHTSEGVDQDAIDAINDFGVRTSLFGEDQRKAKKALILVEGVQRPEASLPSLHKSLNFDIDPIPPTSATRHLFHDLIKQAESASSENRVYYAQDLVDFQDIFAKLTNDDYSSITTLFTPHVADDDAHESAWGTYEMPGLQSPLHRRSKPENEKPLELEETESNTPILHSSAAPISSFANTSQPLRGILPSCFASLSACEATTRNCTAHGRCRRKYTDASSDPSISCYSCQCSTTTSTNEAGNTITTTWGGPACQKKDVSVEFWLIVLFTVGMVFLVGFAIGEIWSMGEAELPSVIGAGVSGPVKRS